MDHLLNCYNHQQFWWLSIYAAEPLIVETHCQQSCYIINISMPCGVYVLLCFRMTACRSTLLRHRTLANIEILLYGIVSHRIIKECIVPFNVCQDLPWIMFSHNVCPRFNSKLIFANSSCSKSTHSPILIESIHRKVFKSFKSVRCKHKIQTF